MRPYEVLPSINLTVYSANPNKKVSFAKYLYLFTTRSISCSYNCTNICQFFKVIHYFCLMMFQMVS